MRTVQALAQNWMVEWHLLTKPDLSLDPPFQAVYKIVQDLAQLADLPCLEWGPAAPNQKNKKPTVVVQAA